jgi:hypothetical protein
VQQRGPIAHLRILRSHLRVMRTPSAGEAPIAFRTDAVGSMVTDMLPLAC